MVLVGLASKNAILIVEFAKHKREAGLSRREATLEACKLRLRPILMTSFAFILGVVPLLVGHGAGAEMRRTLGMAVFSGMLGVTLFGIFLTPVFFYVIEGFVEIAAVLLGRGRGRSARCCCTPSASLTLGLLWLLAAAGRGCAGGVGPTADTGCRDGRGWRRQRRHGVADGIRRTTAAASVTRRSADGHPTLPLAASRLTTSIPK